MSGQHSVDHFDRLPGSLQLGILNKLGDVKALGRCRVASRRLHSLVPQVENVVVRAASAISDDDASSSSSSALPSRFVLLDKITRPFQCILFGGPKRSPSGSSGRSSSLFLEADNHSVQANGTNPLVADVLKNFTQIRLLHVEFPISRGIDDKALLKWKANYGSMLENCVILGASSVVRPAKNPNDDTGDGFCSDESSYMNTGRQLAKAWVKRSLSEASQMHFLLEAIILEHKTLENLVLTVADGQGILCMNKQQLDELREKPLFRSSPESARTRTPDLVIRLWYANRLELPSGTILKDATLVAAIRRREEPKITWGTVLSDVSWVSTAFEEPYGTAAKMLVERLTFRILKDGC